MELKKYTHNSKEKTPKQSQPKPSGVACDEPKCEGQMMIAIPELKHPELKNLKRAKCGECGWRGWV